MVSQPAFIGCQSPGLWHVRMAGQIHDVWLMAETSSGFKSALLGVRTAGGSVMQCGCGGGSVVYATRSEPLDGSLAWPALERVDDADQH